MAAGDAVSPRQFHGSNHIFQPGDQILPGNEVKPHLNSPRSSLVWSTSDSGIAGGFGNNVYEVEHEGLAAPIKGPFPNAQVSLRAKVIRKHETRTHGYAFGKVR